jgi:hypothetical protein
MSMTVRRGFTNLKCYGQWREGDPSLGVAEIDVMDMSR